MRILFLVLVPLIATGCIKYESTFQKTQSANSEEQSSNAEVSDLGKDKDNSGSSPETETKTDPDPDSNQTESPKPDSKPPTTGENKPIPGDTPKPETPKEMPCMIPESKKGQKF